MDVDPGPESANASSPSVARVAGVHTATTDTTEVESDTDSAPGDSDEGEQESGQVGQPQLASGLTAGLRGVALAGEDEAVAQPRRDKAPANPQRAVHRSSPRRKSAAKVPRPRASSVGSLAGCRPPRRASVASAGKKGKTPVNQPPARPAAQRNEGVPGTHNA